MKTDFLLLSYGAPETKEEVVPFLEKLFSGKNVPPERLDAATEKYYEFARHSGRFSPLNEQCRALIAGLLRELNESVPDPEFRPTVYWGNLFWHPLLEETVAEMAVDGVERAVCFATSAFDSIAGNKRYADALEAAREKVGSSAPRIDKLPLPFDHPLFIEAQADRLLEAMAWTSLDDFAAGEELMTQTPVLFSAHSVPQEDADRSRYVSQLLQACQQVAEKCGVSRWELVYQSRSLGRADRWIGPDIGDRIREIAGQGLARSVVVSPIGFFCENMETQNDLDWEIGALCEQLGLGFVRAQAVGASPKICRMIREMIFS